MLYRTRDGLYVYALIDHEIRNPERVGLWAYNPHGKHWRILAAYENTVTQALESSSTHHIMRFAPRD